MICGALIALTPLVCRRRPATYIDSENRGGVFVEDHSIIADAKPETLTPLERLHIALPGHGIAMKSGFHPFTPFRGEGVEVFRGAQREDNRLRER